MEEYKLYSIFSAVTEWYIFTELDTVMIYSFEIVMQSQSPVDILLP
jgi:hypothetical protein